MKSTKTRTKKLLKELDKTAKTDAEVLAAFTSGIEEGQHTSIFLQSPRFVVFKCKGHSAWGGVACPWQYVKAQYMLVRKGSWWMAEDKRTWEGRVSTKILKEALRRSEIFNEVYDGDFAPMCQECDVEMNYGEGYDKDKLVKYWRCDECGWSEDVQE